VDATRTATSRSIGDGVAARLREVAITVVAGGVAGVLVGGLGSRLVMRLAAIAAPEARGAVTENGNVVGDITLAGTVGLVVFAGLASAVIGAGALVVLRPWLPEAPAARGLLLGAILLALFGTAVVDPANADFVLLGDRALNVAMFSALFLAFGLVASVTGAVLDARILPAEHFGPGAWLVSLLVAAPVVPGVLGVAFASASRAALALVGASVVMHAAPAVERRRGRAAATLVRGLATLVMLAAIAVAGAGYVDAVRTIL
jgi:hypothetical protein